MRSPYAAGTGLPLVLVVGGFVSALAQAPTASSTAPRFEVASIRLNNSPIEGPVAVSGTTGAAGNYTNSSSIRVLLQQAYQMPFERQIGGPDWIRTDIYRITAKIPDDVERTPENTRAMVRNLLADRFKLAARQEEREMPVFLLTHARADRRLGRKLQPSRCPPRGSGQPPTYPANAAGVKWEQGPRCGQMGSGRTFIVLGGFPITRLIDLLQFAVGRPIVDHTGLTGDYVAELTFAPQQSAPGIEQDGPSLFTAIQEQLGFKLESSRAAMQVLVIDSIQRPTEN